MCRKGHFNDPEARCCGICGIHSDPHGHEAVGGGRARPLVVKAEGDVISAVHARIELEGWDVLVSDCGSVYGTYVWSPGGTEWERLGRSSGSSRAPAAR